VPVPISPGVAPKVPDQVTELYWNKNPYPLLLNCPIPDAAKWLKIQSKRLGLPSILCVSTLM